MSTTAFHRNRANYRPVYTIADIANALDVELEITARDRQTGIHFASYGVIEPALALGMQRGVLRSIMTTGNTPQTTAQPAMELMREPGKRAALSIAA